MLTPQELKKSPLFQDIGYENYQQMLDCFQAVQRSYRVDEVIYDFSGPAGNAVGVVERGEASLIRIDEEGVATVLEELGPGGVFGKSLAFSTSGRDSLEVVCRTACDVVFIDYPHILKRCERACTHHSLLVQNMLRLISDKAQALSERVDVLSRRSIREKLLCYFNQLAEKEGSLAGQSFGNLFLAALNGISPSFDAAVRRMSQVLAITGRVLPVTTADVQLEAEFENGATVVGESKIFYCKKQEDCRIRQVRLIPSRPKALPEAVSAIADADMIVLGPGSLYTSIIPNLLVDGIVKAIRESDALKVYVCNVMTQEGETEGYTVSDHIAAIFAHSAQGLFRLCLTNSSPIPKAVAARYAEEGAERIRCDKSACAALGVEVVERPVATVESGFVRHSSAALARELILLHAERSVRIAGARFRPREDSYQMEEQK